MMRLKEIYLFIGKSLALRRQPEKAEEVRAMIRSGTISYEKLVWVSSNQYVLPALYVALRDALLLEELPGDLVEHFEQLYQMNVTRNELLLAQARNITRCLNEQGMAPVFLKGMGHLLDGLYADPGERMIGDIDILLPFGELEKAAEALREQGYYKNYGLNPDHVDILRHYPRLRHDAEPAAVELHWELVHAPYRGNFGFDLLNANKKPLEMLPGSYLLSDPHQVVFNMMHGQVNDFGYAGRKIFMRQLYDLFLLSRRTDPYEAVKAYGRLQRPLRANIALVTKVMGNSGSEGMQRNLPGPGSRMFVRQVMFFINHPRAHRRFRMGAYLRSRLRRYFRALGRASRQREYRQKLVNNILSRAWRRQHFHSYRQIRTV